MVWARWPVVTAVWWPGEMMMQQVVDELLDLVQRRQPDQAMDLVRGLLDSGWDRDAVIANVLAPVQVEVGSRWESGSWTIAQEHAATGVVQAALGELRVGIRVPTSRGQVVVACVEHEWHSLPTRLLNERLRLRGWGTEFLGASTPSDALRKHVENADVLAVVVSCQMGMSLPGVARAIEAVHQAGLPVVAGGSALGTDQRRATVLGADGWAPSIDALDSLLDTWSQTLPVELGAAQDDGGEHLQVMAQAPEIARAVREELGTRWPAQDAEFEHALGFLSGAVVADDPLIFVDYVAWLRGLAHRRGSVDDVVGDMIGGFATRLAGTLPRARVALARSQV